MNEREQLAKDNGMTIEFVNWFFDNKKDGCGNAWFIMMAAMWEGWSGREAKCAALAAENAALKEWSPNPHSASMFEAIEKAEALMDDGMPELAMVEAFEILKMKRTPATDAFLAEVRAQGVEMFGNLTIKIGEEECEEDIVYAGKQALLYASQLRQEASQ